MGNCASKTPEPASTKPVARRTKQSKPTRPAASDHSGNVDSTGSSSDTQPEKHQSSPAAANGTTNPVELAGNQPESDSTTRNVKVLLLGSGESGKSTIVKQMKILHQNGYSKEEAYEYTPFVYKNVLDCIKNVLNAIKDLQPELIKQDPVTETKPENGAVEETIAPFKGEATVKAVVEKSDIDDILNYNFTMDSDESFDSDIAAKIKKIYSTSEVLKFTKTQQGNFYLIDSTHYFLTEIDRIAQPGYVPSVNDILRTRKKTSGIFDFKFEMGGGLNIHMYDVGGQRSERKKWIHCFDNVTLIIFCVALSEYDQVLLEENSQNRLEESLTLFDSVVNSRWFARTSIVLFLNKIDVFAEKLAYSPLEAQFPDYTGGNNINKAAKYILWRFTQLNRSGLNIFPHVTQATDTSNIQLVFVAVKETILENSLRDSGIL